VAYAVVRDDPPQVYLAADIDTLQRLLALEVVARTDPVRLAPSELEELRASLLDERWGDAVYAWISHTDIAVDVYTHIRVYGEADLPADLIGAQLQFAPVFREA
jgi:hypothetical protein